ATPARLAMSAMLTASYPLSATRLAVASKTAALLRAVRPPGRGLAVILPALSLASIRLMRLRIGGTTSCAIASYRERSACPEHALEDGVDVLQVVAEIELLVDLGVRQILLHAAVLLQERIEVAFAAPDRHGV